MGAEIEEEGELESEPPVTSASEASTRPLGCEGPESKLASVLAEDTGRWGFL